MKLQTRTKFIDFGLAYLITVPLALGSTAGKPDRLTPLEKAETAKVANDVAERIVALERHDQSNEPTKVPASKSDSLLACSIAHGDSYQAANADEKVFSLTTENAQDDPAVFRIATQMQSQHQLTVFAVSAWPSRTSSTRGTYTVLVHMHKAVETIGQPDKINAACR